MSRDELTAETSHPHFAKYGTAKWPSPPTPTTATRSVDHKLIEWLEARKARFVIVARLTGSINRKLPHLRYVSPSLGVGAAEFRYQTLRQRILLMPAQPRRTRNRRRLVLPAGGSREAAWKYALHRIQPLTP